MSNKRHRSIRDVKDERGPNGRLLCRYCRQETKPPRLTFCSSECVHQWKIRSSGSYAAQCVFERDAGICARCHIDTEKRRQDARLELLAAPKAVRRSDEGPDEWAARWDSGRQAVIAGWKAAGWPDNTLRVWFDVDHIIPVVYGGGDAGLDNLQTLCTPCHRASTKQLAQKRAAERKAKKVQDAQNSAALDPGDQSGSGG